MPARRKVQGSMTYVYSHIHSSDQKLVAIDGDPVLAASDERLVDLLKMGLEFFIVEQNVIDYLDAVLQILKNHVTAKVEDITCSCEAHWSSTVLKASVRHNKDSDHNMITFSYCTPRERTYELKKYNLKKSDFLRANFKILRESLVDTCMRLCLLAFSSCSMARSQPLVLGLYQISI